MVHTPEARTFDQFFHALSEMSRARIGRKNNDRSLYAALRSFFSLLAAHLSFPSTSSVTHLFANALPSRMFATWRLRVDYVRTTTELGSWYENLTATPRPGLPDARVASVPRFELLGI